MVLEFTGINLLMKCTLTNVVGVKEAFSGFSVRFCNGQEKKRGEWLLNKRGLLEKGF